MKKVRNKYERPISIFRKHDGILRTGEAITAGIHPRTLYAMRDEGIVEALSRGVYRLSEMQPLGDPDLISVALRIPKGVVCLISALAFHEITTQIPHQVYIAIDRHSRPPYIEFPPIRVFRFTGEAYKSEIETNEIEGIQLRVYCPEKTIADCFKYRNKIGLDVALEALKLYRERTGFKIDDLIHFARVCRVEKVMRPYLEAII
jgi:predicted transcriptional regulator of viral defense system